MCLIDTLKKILFFNVFAAFLITFVFNDFIYAKDIIIDKKSQQKAYANSVITDISFKNNSVLIIHIWDLHANPSVQKEIVNIIEFYDKIKPIKRIYAEGAPAGKVEQSLFNSIDGKLKKSILDKMLDNGQIGACEYYTSYNNRDILYGLEEKELYNTNLELINRMMILNKENRKFLDNVLGKCNSIKKKNLRKDLYEVNNAINEIYRDSYSKINSFFKDDPAFEKERYKIFLDYLAAKEKNFNINYKEVPKQISQLNKYLSSKMGYKDFLTFSGLLSENSDKEATARAYEIIAAKAPEVKVKFPDAFNILEANYLSYNINLYDVYAQKEELKEYFVKKYFSRKEKEIYYLFETVTALNRLYSLDISRKELLKFLDTKDIIKDISLKYLSVAESNTLASLAENKITELIYANNLQRDKVFFKTIRENIDMCHPQTNGNILTENCCLDDFKEIYIVVTGGFHMGFTEFLRENGISYMCIAPKLKGEDGSHQHYLDLISFPLSTINKKIHYIQAAFAPPLLNIINNSQNNEMKEIMLKNIVNAWVSSGTEQGFSKRSIYEDIYKWVQSNGISEEDIEKSETLKRVRYGKNGKRQVQSDNSSLEDESFTASEKEKKKSIIFERIKSFLGIAPQHWSFPDLVLSSTFLESANSYASFVSLIKESKKKHSLEIFVRRDSRGFYLELAGGFKISLTEALKIIEQYGGRKKNILINLDENMEDEDDIFYILDKKKYKITLISKNSGFIKRHIKEHKDIKFVYGIKNMKNEKAALEEIKEMSGFPIAGIYTEQGGFQKLGSYVFTYFNNKTTALYINSKTDHSYSDFIFENKNKLILITDNYDEDKADMDESRTAYRNVKVVPLIQLVVGMEFFAAFTTIFFNQELGYSLSFISIAFAICGPMNILGSLLSSWFSKIWGKRNVIVTNLFLHCIGDSLLLLAGLSPIILVMSLAMQSLAAAGVGTLLIPFLNSSLTKIGKSDSFERVYGNTRSIFWIGLGVSSVIGSWLALFIGQTGVIAFSCIVITSLSIYSFIVTGSLKKQTDIEELTDEEKEFSNLKEHEKIIKVLRIVFGTRGLNTTVIMNFIVDTGLFVLFGIGLQTMLVNAGISLAWLGIIMFAGNIIQSFSSKIVHKVSSFINNSFKRTIYFTSLTVLAAGFIMFNNPVILIVFYILANFWQGAASVIEPAKIEKKLSDDISPYWFSIKIILISALTAGMQLLLCASLSIFSLNAVFMTVVTVVLAASGFFGFLFKEKQGKDGIVDRNISNTIYIRQILSAA